MFDKFWIENNKLKTYSKNWVIFQNKFEVFFIIVLCKP